MSQEERVHPHRVTQVVDKCSRCEELLKQQEQSAAAWKRDGAVFGISIVIGLLVWGILVVVSAITTSSPKPKPRATKCYFVRHQRYEDNEKHSHQWDPWHVFESAEEGSQNIPATNEVFTSKQAAWDFILKWNLEPCR